MHRAKYACAFLILFAAYQAPEAVARWTQNQAWFAALMLIFPIIAIAVARGLGGAQALSLQGQAHAGARFFSGVPLGFAFSLAAIFAPVMLGWSHFHRMRALPEFAGMLLLIWVVSLFASFAEDVVTRGLVFRWFGRGMAAALFIAISAAIYTLNHIYVLGRGPLFWLYLFSLGCALAVPLVRSGALWTTIGIHWGWNMAYHLAAQAFLIDEVAGAPSSLWTSTAAAMLLGIALWIFYRRRG